MISFTSSVHSLNNDSRLRASTSANSTDDRIDSVDYLVSLLGCNDIDKISTHILAMSSTPTNCDMMRHHRYVDIFDCILLVLVLSFENQQSPVYVVNKHF